MLQTISTFFTFLTFFEDFNHEVREYGLDYLRKTLDRLTWVPKKEKKTQIRFCVVILSLHLEKWMTKIVIAEAERNSNNF